MAFRNSDPLKISVFETCQQDTLNSILLRDLHLCLLIGDDK